MTINAKIRMFLLLLLACSAMPAYRAMALDEAQTEWQKTCDRVANVPFPPGDRPTPADRKALQNCGSYGLYYGFDQPPDPRRARLCAYDEMDRDQDDGPFNGKAMLMTIYANGVGARRNLDLAIRLACETGGAPAEIEGRVDHLTKLRAENWQGNDFSLCDDITSGYMAGFCADHANRFASRTRMERLERLQSRWSGADRREFALLRKTSLQYFEIHSGNEVDQSGTARAALSIEDAAAREDDFMETLEKLEKGTFPAYSGQQFRDADAKLNAFYQRVQKKSDPEWGTITKEGIRETQRMWIRYRDAWVRFCGRKYPRYSPDSIRTELTLKRINELEAFLN